jgi:ADP-ribose pyrophosphatase YjhB (NUDIX family)
MAGYIIACGILLKDANNVLLVQRAGKGDRYEGQFALPGGRADGGETPRQAAARELFEETGLLVEPQSLKLVHTWHRFAEDGQEVVGMIFQADAWSGIPSNKEPDKHTQVGWFATNALPEALTPMMRGIIREENGSYTEW